MSKHISDPEQLAALLNRPLVRFYTEDGAVNNDVSHTVYVCLTLKVGLG
jgi:hypothetical protein